VTLSGTVSVGQENRPQAAFGLQDNDLHGYSVALDLTPRDTVGATLSYGFENYSTRQRSRQANPGVQFDDPTRDWWTDVTEDVHTVGLRLDLLAPGRSTMSAGYDYVGSHTGYLYTLAPNSTLAVPQQLEPVHNRLHTATVDVRRPLTPRLGLGVGYRFDHDDIEDFARSPGTLNSPLIPTLLNLMVQWRPYTAHTGFVRLFYTF